MTVRSFTAGAVPGHVIPDGVIKPVNLSTWRVTALPPWVVHTWTGNYVQALISTIGQHVTVPTTGQLWPRRA